MFILYAIPIGIVAGWLAGGHLDRLAAVRIRWAPVALIGLLVQVVLFTEPFASSVGDAGPAIYVASSVAVLAVVLRNLDIPGVGAHRGRRRVQPRGDRRQRRLDAGRSARPGIGRRRRRPGRRTASWCRILRWRR